VHPAWPAPSMGGLLRLKCRHDEGGNLSQRCRRSGTPTRRETMNIAEILANRPPFDPGSRQQGRRFAPRLRQVQSEPRGNTSPTLKVEPKVTGGREQACTAITEGGNIIGKGTTVLVGSQGIQPGVHCRNEGGAGAMGAVQQGNHRGLAGKSRSRFGIRKG
jgi:hypothetical protein